MHFLSSVLKKNEFFGGGKKSGIRVFIEAWYLSTRLPGGWFEKIRTLNTNEDTSPLMTLFHLGKHPLQCFFLLEKVG